MSYKSIDDLEFRNNSDALIAQAVYNVLSKELPIKSYEASLICKAFGVQHRFNVVAHIQECSSPRLNLFTNNDGKVYKINIE